MSSPFNFETFTDRVDQFKAGNDAFNWTRAMKCARLYVFTPVVMANQFLRPYVYDFKQGLKEMLSTTSEKLRKSLMGHATDSTLGTEIYSAIRPSADGIPLDTSPLNQQWSFFLIADSRHMSSNPLLQDASPIQRLIATGYCSEEPVNPSTGTINPHAYLVFTKTTTMHLVSSIGASGPTFIPRCGFDVDIVDDRVAQLAHQRLYTTTPKDLVNGIHPSGGVDLIFTPGDADVSNIKAGPGFEAKMINNTLNTPTNQLGDIVQCIESGYTTEEAFANPKTNEDEYPLSGTGYGNADDSTFSDDAFLTFKNLLQSSTAVSSRQSIDTSRPWPMEELCKVFVNVDVIPVQVPIASPWDASDQGRQTARNQMSAMLSSSLPNLLVETGLASMNFRYDSYSGPSAFEFGSSGGIFHPLGWSTIANCTPKQQETCVEQFKSLFIMHIVPIIKTARGEFTLMACLDVTGYILIDLEYLDDGVLPGTDGWYETNAKLGGYMTPMMAPEKIFEHNATQLVSLQQLLTDTRRGRTYRFPTPRPILDATGEPIADQQMGANPLSDFKPWGVSPNPGMGGNAPVEQPVAPQRRNLPLDDRPSVGDSAANPMSTQFI